MLTKKEFEQLQYAINTMQGPFSVGDRGTVFKDTVIGLIDKFKEAEQKEYD